MVETLCVPYEHSNINDNWTHSSKKTHYLMNQFVLLRVLFWHCEWNLEPQHTRALSEYCWKSLPFASLHVKMIERYKYSVIYLVKLQSVCSYYSRYSGFNTESIKQSNNLFVSVVAFVYPQYSHSKFMNRLSKKPA